MIKSIAKGLLLNWIWPASSLEFFPLHMTSRLLRIFSSPPFPLSEPGLFDEETSYEDFIKLFQFQESWKSELLLRETCEAEKFRSETLVSPYSGCLIDLENLEESGNLK